MKIFNWLFSGRKNRKALAEKARILARYDNSYTPQNPMQVTAEEFKALAGFAEERELLLEVFANTKMPRVNATITIIEDGAPKWYCITVSVDRK